MQTLFEHDFRDDSKVEEIRDRNLNEYKNKADIDFVCKSIEGVLKDKTVLDQMISESAPEWPLDQISNVDKSTLELAIFEMLNYKDTPHKVIINEAVELAKQFGGESSSKFVNGVLGTVFNKINKSNDNK